MYNCNDLLSKCVLSLFEGELLGNVDKLYFDKKLKKLQSIELIAENDTRFLLPAKNIYRIGKNAITVKNKQAINLKTDNEAFCACPIGSKAYSINGEYLGTVNEISLTAKLTSEKICLENDVALNVDMLASCGKSTLVFYDKISKPKLSKFHPSKNPNQFKQTDFQTAEILPLPELKAEVSSSAKPNIQNADFLLGRICTKDIYNFNNELLIKAHGTVNKKNLKEINKYGKIRELMLFSK